MLKSIHSINVVYYLREYIRKILCSKNNFSFIKKKKNLMVRLFLVKETKG